MRTIRELKNYIPISKIFEIFKDEIDTVILESSLQNKLGRFSIIGRKPYLKLVKGKEFTINGEISTVSFSEYFTKYLKENKEENPTELPIVSGAIGYISYDFNRDTKSTLPESVFIFYDEFIIEDHTNQKIYLISNGKFKDSKLSVDHLEALIANSKFSFFKESKKMEIEVIPNFEKEEYKNAIDKMINYIVEGDIYIANMTQRLDVYSKKKPYDVFQELRNSNPSPFGAFLNYENFQVVCSSPERFLYMKDNKVLTRPIKGTRKRGANEEEDIALKKELVNSEKDKSELLMIVDLERNDLNRVCKPGSVIVDELFTVESYATVHHLVSSISGELCEGLTAVDLINATFPGGSITGAPKIRAMEIIEELEHGNRGLYTGTIGYISLNGDCDLNIVIRTAIHRNGVYSLGVGGGITYESDLEFEYEETLQKARAILEALK